MPDENKKKKQRESMNKWLNKEYKCPHYEKTMKNKSKYLHNKK